MTNKEYAATKEFQEKCQKYNIQPTGRQASKYRDNRGLLYKLENGIIRIDSILLEAK